MSRWTEKARACGQVTFFFGSVGSFRRRALLTAAPVQLADFGRAAGEIPVAAEGAQRLLSALATMISGAIQYSEFSITVSLLAILAADRRHRAVDDLRDLEEPRLVAGLVGDRHLLDAEELADQDRQQRGRAAGLAGEDLGQRLDRVDRGALVDEQAGRPVAAAHIAGDFHDQAEIEAGQVDLAEMTGIDRGIPPRSGNSLRSADGCRATARRGRTPCNCRRGRVPPSSPSFDRPSDRPLCTSARDY